MKVIVSKTLSDSFNDYVVVRSLKEVLNKKGVTVVILHSTDEKSFDLGVFISKLKEKGVNNFFYISEDADNSIRLLISSLGGFYTNYEYYFEEEEELTFLIDDVLQENEEKNKKTKEDEYTSIAAPALNTIMDFVEGFVRGDERVKAPIYLEQVNNAINELASVTQIQETQISDMGYNALDIYKTATQYISNMDAQRRIVEEKLDKLERGMANTTSSKSAFGNSINFFSPFKYMGNSKVLVVREYSPCRYLTTFILGYFNHLQKELNKRSKLIFVHQKGQGVSLKYQEFTSITQESMKMSSLYEAEIIATNNPKKEVMKELLYKANDVIIVVDRLYGRDNIVTGRVTTINAVGSRGDIKRYNIKPENTIFSVTKQQNELFDLPIIKNFPTEKDARIASYHQVMKNNYIMLDKMLGI